MLFYDEEDRAKLKTLYVTFGDEHKCVPFDYMQGFSTLSRNFFADVFEFEGYVADLKLEKSEVGSKYELSAHEPYELSIMKPYERTAVFLAMSVGLFLKSSFLALIAMGSASFLSLAKNRNLLSIGAAVRTLFLLRVGLFYSDGEFSWVYPFTFLLFVEDVSEVLLVSTVERLRWKRDVFLATVVYFDYTLMYPFNASYLSFILYMLFTIYRGLCYVNSLSFDLQHIF